MKTRATARWFVLVLGMAVLSMGVGRLVFAGNNDPFDKANELPASAESVKKPEAPAQPAKQEPVKPEVAPAKPVFKDPRTLKIAERLSIVATLSKAKVAPGEDLTLTLRGTPQPGFYTYPLMTQQPSGSVKAQSEMLPNYPGDSVLRPIKPFEESELYYDSAKKLYKHKAPFTWTQQLRVSLEAKEGKHQLVIPLKIQVCEDQDGKQVCIGPAAYPPLTVEVEVAGPAKVLTDVEKEQLKKLPPLPGTNATTQQPTTLWGLLGSAALGAFLMLLTPCVFPMIPITVNFFLKQSEKEHHNPLLNASIYSGTIIILLTLVVLVLGSVVIDLANNAYFNLGLGLVLIFFALSLFGMYEIELPQGLARFTSAREGQGGIMGTVFMALTFTITSFTCTGPFLGVLLAPVAGLQPPMWHLVLAALVYSTTFAAPFFVLALFPSLIKKLPKSGGWLNSVKVVMGFLELAAALKFLANFDIAWFPGNPRIFSYDTVLCAWIAIAVATGFYLLGSFRLPHDDPQDHIGVPRMVLASIFFGLAFYMAPLLWNVTPAGLVSEAIVAFLPPSFRDNGQLHWTKDYEEAWREAIKDNKPMLLDFTGVNCTNCRDNEKNVFPKPQVVALLKQYARVALYTDTVPKPDLTSAQASEEALRHVTWQGQFNDISLPTYILFMPGRDGAFTKDRKLNGTVLDKRTGLITNINDFVQALDGGLKKYAELAPKQRPTEEALTWRKDYLLAWQDAVKEKKPLILQFAAAHQTKADDKEKDALPKPEVADKLKSYARAILYIYTVPESGLPDAEVAKMTAAHRAWQAQFQDHSVPLYVLFHPDALSPFTQDGKLNGTLLEKRVGLLAEPNVAVQFLASGLKKHAAVALVKPPEPAPTQNVSARPPQPVPEPTAGLTWSKDYQEVWKEAVKQKQPIFVDFTGVACINCKLNEKKVFPQPEVVAQLKKYARVALYTDNVPGLPEDESTKRAEQNVNRLAEYGDGAIPLYVILQPNSKQPFTADGKLDGKVLGKRVGLITDVKDFVRFLEEGVSKNAQADAGAQKAALTASN